MKQVWTAFISNLTPAQATCIIILTAVCFGTVPWFGRELLDQGMASPAISFYRYFLTALLFFKVLNFSKALRTETFWSIGSGVCVGLGWITYVEALKVVPVSAVSVIYMTYPLFTLVASWLLIGNRPSKKSVFAGCLITVASVIAFVPDNLNDSAKQALLIAFLAPLAFGLAIAILTDKQHNLSPLSRVAGFSTGASLGLLPVMFQFPMAEIVPQDPSLWKYIVGLAILTALIPQYLYVTLAPLVGSARTAMAGCFELPTMFLIGYFAYDESIGLLQILSAVLVMTAIVITPAISSHRRIAEFAEADPEACK